MSRRPSLTERRRLRAAAAKERKRKIFAFAGIGVLGVLLFIQGPRMLELFSGSTPTPVAAPPPATPAPPEEEVPETPRFNSGTVDPFAVRGLGDNDPEVGNVEAPAGMQDPFERPDAGPPAPSETPAAPTPTPSPQPLPKRIIVGTPTPGGASTRGWIVVLASIPTSSGRGTAERFATRVRRDGLTNIGVLLSSANRPLRAGYFVVYNGPYATLNAVQRAADHVHAFGYRTAYVREIIRY